MNPLDLIALIFIPVMIIFAAAAIVFPGSLPGKIACKRRPGEIAVGKVACVTEYTGEGQLELELKIPVAAEVARTRGVDERLVASRPVDAPGVLILPGLRVLFKYGCRLQVPGAGEESFTG